MHYLHILTVVKEQLFSFYQITRKLGELYAIPQFRNRNNHVLQY